MLPAIIIAAGIVVSFQMAGIYGIGIAATTMLALAGMVVALDAYGLLLTTLAVLLKWLNLMSLSVR